MPLSRKYLPTLQELATAYSERGVWFVLVNPMQTDSSDDMQAAAKSFRLQLRMFMIRKRHWQTMLVL